MRLIFWFIFYWGKVSGEVSQTLKSLQTAKISLDQHTVKQQGLKLFLEHQPTDILKKDINYATTKCKKEDRRKKSNFEYCQKTTDGKEGMWGEERKIFDAVHFHQVGTPNGMGQITSVLMFIVSNFCRSSQVLPVEIYDEFSIVDITESCKKWSQGNKTWCCNFWYLLWSVISINLCQNIHV